MLYPPIPSDEAERQKVLEGTGLLDAATVQVLDDIVALAAQICRVPIALVSLVDRDRQIFKARVGLDVTETPRQFSLCAHVVASREPLVVEDTTLDERFADNPLITGPPHIRFYAGVPLIIDQRQALGTLCIVDRVPRQLGIAERDALGRLGRIAMIQIEEFRQRRVGPVHHGS